MSYRVVLRDRTTGVERESETFEGEYCGEQPASFIWEYGNFSCDCNRAIFYDLDDDEEVPCGTSRFELVRVIENDNG